MNPKCKACKKTVYPMEKLNCLDAYWHKGCFRCKQCSLTLSMKTYKGYNKEPYCNAHYPTTKFTAVADTPENMRLKKNTANQSNVVYHKEFEKLKGSKLSVSDDPATERARQNTKIQSNVVYHDLQGTRSEEDRRRRIEKDQLAGTYNQDMARQAPRQEVPVVPAQVGSLYDRDEPQQPTEPQPQVTSSHETKFLALYDYNAADEDEVSFEEGDIIIDGEIIDQGWMTGTVERTGQHGMLPSNYVERI